MPYAVDYKLADLLGIAGATIGIIIAGAILLGAFDGRYVQLFDRYRALTGEYRANSSSDPRKESLRCQIKNYRRRINLINIASVCVSAALLLFVLTVGVASLSVVYPHVMALRFAGTLGLILGLFLIAVAVALGGVDVILSREAISPEVADFEDIPNSQRLFSD